MNVIIQLPNDSKVALEIIDGLIARGIIVKQTQKDVEQKPTSLKP